MNPIDSPLLKTTTISFFRSRGTSRRKIASAFHTVGIVAVQKQHTVLWDDVDQLIICYGSGPGGNADGSAHGLKSGDFSFPIP